MASPVNAITDPTAAAAAAAAATSTPTPSPGLGGTAPTEQMFLQLLVAQLQNQDPLNPMDNTQFVAQLAQFSELEQVINIRSDIESYHAQAAAAAAAAATTTTTANGTSQPSTTQP